MMQVKQAHHQCLQLATVALGMTQVLRRRVQELVGQTVRQLVQHVRGILAPGQQLERMFHLVASRPFSAIA